MENEKAIDTVRQVGYSLAGNIGATAFVELELAYASRLLPRFSDDPIIRKNQGILLYWQRGYYKSTILQVFSQTIPQDMGTVDISSMTQEKIFGSIDEKKRHIIQPAFTNDVKFVLVSELSSLLGQHDAMRQFVNLSNAVLENERISRQTLKLGWGEINDTELLELQDKGVFYDAVKGELSYTPDVCFLAATRPLDNRYFTYLKESGHFSRYHVIQRDISESDVKEHFRKDYTLDQKVFDQLKQINLALSHVEVKKVFKPSESLLQPVYDNIIELVKDELSSRRDLSFADIITPRTKGDIIREIAAHAFLRTTAQNDSTVIEELQYAKEDLDFVLDNPYHFVEFALNPIIAPEMSRPQRSHKREKIKEAILECLNDETEKHIDDVRGFVAKKLAPLLVSQATFYNGLKELKDTGRIDKSKPDFYMITREVR